MGTLKKLAGQTAVYGISSIVSRLLNYLLTPYLTRILTPEAYGVNVDMYALIPFALVVLTMGMESGYFRFAGKACDEEQKRRVFASTWGATCAAAALFLTAVLLLREPIAAAMGYAGHSSYIAVVAAIIALDVATAIPMARLRERGEALKFVTVRVLSVVVTVVLSIGFGEAGLYRTSFGVGYVFVANLVASGAVLAMVLPMCQGVRPRVEWRTLKPILLYSMPLLVSGIAGTANEFIDRQMIKYLTPDSAASMAQLGIYGAVVKIAVVMTLFTQMYRMAAEPFFLAGFKKEEFTAANAEAMKYFIIVSTAIFLGIALFADLFALIVGSDFREGVFILPVVLGANLLSGVVLNLSFWYKQTGKTLFAIAVTCTGLLFTVVFNILLVPRMGYLGAAWARLVCEAAMVAVSWYLNRRYCPTPYDLRRIGGYLLLGAVLYAAGTRTASLPPVAHYACNALLVFIFCAYAVRRERIDVAGLLRTATGRLTRRSGR